MEENFDFSQVLLIDDLTDVNADDLIYVVAAIQQTLKAGAKSDEIEALWLTELAVYLLYVIDAKTEGRETYYAYGMRGFKEAQELTLSLIHI